MAEQIQHKQFIGVKKFTYRGLQLEELIKLPMDKLVEQFRARQRRRISNQGEKVHAFQNLMRKFVNQRKKPYLLYKQTIINHFNIYILII
ncbi:unnamed protein product [Paramecium sonneborni]|uniref:Ribosomal protein S15 n=1 Tax=Paramecium sonneborni TaxID=65129 RepID=A0A8S1RUP6_9CILI|nr:unnamed protein product [Paramecium sonneborni]